LNRRVTAEDGMYPNRHFECGATLGRCPTHSSVDNAGAFSIRGQ
jgi:hypothetical protein